MKFRLAIVLVPLILFGCGAPPAEQPVVVVSEADSGPGFFTDLQQFWDVTEIQRIGTAEGEEDAGLYRLNKRYEMIIDHHRDRIKDARIVDFGSYDGRWAYAALDAGAKHVTGIEISPEYAAHAATNMQELGVPADRYEFIVADVLEQLRNTAPGEYDGVICAGFYYHIWYHVELMQELERIGVKWIIMDTSVATGDKASINWIVGPNGLEGVPSLAAIKLFAGESGFQVDPIPGTQYEGSGMWDYSMSNRMTMTIYK